MKTKISVIIGILLICAIAYGGRERWLKITQYLMVGTQTRQGKVTFFANSASEDIQVIRGMSGQTGDLLDCQNSAGTTLAKIASDGDLTAVDGAFTGNMTITGAFVLPGKTSDPCTTLGVGAMFRNTTSDRVCFCDSNTDDKIVDGSTDCFESP